MRSVFESRILGTHTYSGGLSYSYVDYIAMKVHLMRRTNLNNSQRKRFPPQIIDSVKRQLDSLLPGLMTRIDWFFLHRTGKGLVEVFIEDPREAVAMLNEFFGEENSIGERTRFVIYLMLKTLFLGNRGYLDKAYNYILNRRYDEFKELVARFLRGR